MANVKCNKSKEIFKNRFKSYKFSIIQNVKEFCRHTTLHGLSYLTDSDLYPLEKGYFAIAFVTVVILAGFFVMNVYIKWNTTPVIFSINPQPTYITNEPFPALTICNMNQGYKSKVEQYDSNSRDYAIIQMLCKTEVNVTVAHTIDNWNSLSNLITNISQPCENMLLSCHFGGIEQNCDQIFHPIVTDEGLCCTFNMVHTKFMYTKGTKSLINEVSKNYTDIYEPVPWNAEKGYPKKLPKHFYPRKAAGTGEALGLTVVLDVEADEYYCSSSNSIGFKMIMHSPTETPNVREVGLSVAAGYETKARININKLETDPKLRQVDLKYRQCFFQDEYHLEYFSSYSQPNCEAECVANSLLRYCGCLSHFMPKKYGNESVCSIFDIECVKRITLESMLMNDGDDGGDGDKERECSEICLPSCFDLKFYADFFMTPLINTGFKIVNQRLQDMTSEYVERNIAILNVYYKDASFRSNKQTEFIGMTDVLSSIGGLISLFFGFSFISLAEILFYILIRPWRRARKGSSNVLLSEKSRNSNNSIGHLMKASSMHSALNERRKYSRNSSAFRVPRQIRNVSTAIDVDHYYVGHRSFQDHNMDSLEDKDIVIKRDWRYDHMY